MKKKGLYLLGIAVMVVGMLAPASLYSFTDQTTSERILKENKHFIQFIDVCLSNFGPDRMEKFRTIYKKHFNADVAYLQADYKRAFKGVYRSQGEMVDLYEDLLKNFYLENSKKILDKIAPMIIRSKNARARLYLTLGYRDRTVCWTHYTVGEASNPKLFSYKLYQYEEAIKVARRAKRYAFLALFESQNAATKRRIYVQLMKNENTANNPFFSRFVGLDEQGMIRELSRSFEEYEKEQAKPATAEPAAQKGDVPFEKNVEKRVRFRNESRAARFLLNTEFDKAEDIMRTYIDDFNFKLIVASFEGLSKSEPADAATQPGTTPGAASGAFLTGDDVKNYQVELMDNYIRYSKPSVLETFYTDMKVEDVVEESSNVEASDAEIESSLTTRPEDAAGTQPAQTTDKPAQPAPADATKEGKAQ